MNEAIQQLKKLVNRADVGDLPALSINTAIEHIQDDEFIDAIFELGRASGNFMSYEEPYIQIMYALDEIRKGWKNEEPIQFMDSNQIAEKLRINRQMVNKMAATGRFPKNDLQIGHQHRWYVETYNRWVKENGTSKND